MSQLGQNRKSWPSSGTSALPPATDIVRQPVQVRFVPTTDIADSTSYPAKREIVAGA